MALKASIIHDDDRASTSTSSDPDKRTRTNEYTTSYSSSMSQEDRNRAFRTLLQSLSVLDFVDPSKTWVLVPNGSLMGYFDWVPEHFRVGPWSVVAVVYLTILFYVALLAGAYFVSSLSQPWWPIDLAKIEYSVAYTAKWWYHVAASFWMIYVLRLIWEGPLSLRAWGTYTVQSWTLLLLRHVLCALAPFSHHFTLLAEYTRFPVACSATVTFVVWNFVLFPVCYLFLLPTAEQKERFWKFCTSFRLVQIHGFNIVFCLLNVYWASPPRALQAIDLYFAVMSVMIYLAWYLWFLDRLGVHLYPIFTPRDGRLVIISWSLLLGVYLGIFEVWRRLFA